jgi:hypothetical protein
MGIETGREGMGGGGGGGGMEVVGVEMERQRQSKKIKKMEKRYSSMIFMPLVLHKNLQGFL